MSYRSSYVPYKSNLPTSYKSGSSSAYSSRDDVTSNDLKNTSSPRFAPLASPSAFRPSYSGGTYRSIPIKRDNNYTQYVSRYPSGSNVSDKEKSVETTKTTSTNKYLGSSTSKDSTPVCNHKISRYSSTSTGNLSRYGQKSRDPSPAIDRRTSPAPLSSTLRARSRDPSPALQDNKLSSSSAKLNSAINYPTYRMGSRPTSSGYGSNSRYGSNSSSLPRTSATLAERALSYMTTNEMRIRVKQQREKSAERKLREQEASDKEKTLSESTNSATADAISSIETLEEQNSITTYPLVDIEPEVFIPVKVVTRATSPTPPGSTTFTRTRRLDIAKTIEKVIQRSSRKPIYADKEMQSDRLDDSTKYSRFGSTRMSSCTWSDSSKYSSGKYSGSSATSTPSRTNSRSEIDSIDKSKKDEIAKTSLNRLCAKKESQSKPSSDSSKSSKLSPPKSVTTNKQKSSENSTNSSSGARSSLPPTCPKSEASTKTSISSTTTNSGTKWTNKDFRKSALNVGPTDRPRKSRTPSDSEDNQNKSGSGAAFINGTFQYVQRLERSPSVGSETSNTSTATSSSLSNNTSDNQENINKRCHQPKIKSSPQTNKNSQIPNQIQLQSNEKILVNVLEDNKKIFGNDNSTKTESNSGCENFINTEQNVTGKQEKLTSPPPTPPPQTISSTTALFKYLQINSPPIESSSLLPSQKQEELQITTSLKNDENKNLLIRKLGSVSNFLIARVEQDSDSEQIYFDNNSSSNSISDGLKQNVTTASKANTSIASKLSKKNSLKKNSSNDSSSTNNEKNSITKLPIVELTNNLVNQNTENEITIGCSIDQNNRSSSEKIVDIDDSSSGLDTNKQINTDSAFDITDNDMKYKIRHIDSGEMAWWMKDNNNIINDDNDDATTIPEDLNSLNQQDEQTSESIDLSSAWWSRHNENSGSSNKSQISKKLQKQDSNEKPFWWINENDVTTKSMNSIDKNKSRSNGYNDTNNNNNTQELNCWQKDNYTDNFHINKDQSNIISCLNEPPWFKNTNNTNNNNKYCTNYESSQNSDNKFNNKLEITSNGGISLNKIQRVQSGERPWWLDDTSSSTNNLKNNQNKEKSLSNSDNGSYKPWYLAGPTKKLLNLQRIESGEKAWWLQENPSVEEKSDNESNSSSSDENDDDDDEIHHVINNKPNYQNYNNSLFNQLEIPLGDRASPEGLEDDSSKSRKSPYDNIPSKNNSSDNDKLKQQQQQLTNAEINLQKLFISRHTNIDELLGGSCRPISPILDRIMTKNLFLEEIKPSQVRIHDSTAQMPTIQRMDRDEWDYSARDSMLYDFKQNNLDDAALQVYKDGDFGAYLDLESSLAEQTEEIEGLNSSRKNSIVVRTQLSVRVHAIIEKLLSSEGTELRRALFSLKQIFQEDKDLVHGFVALGGLNCLVRVGNGADQNYQNCILRALGQVMLYVDGMNGVMKHSPTIQWLYSLIASKYRLVVKTALKLLLVFVEYVESNCYLLVNAIHIVDIAQGITPWTNIMKLLKDYDNADTELLIYATSLINKTLSGLSDQDSFYDESDLLEQQGMEGVIQRYMSRPGTDLDLLDQLQLYEAVLKFEDGETDGIRLPDSSVRKTLRYRSTDSTERRKSRRHSTGTSPLNKTVSSPKRFTPNSNGILDEDSSSSNEFQNNGVFRECKAQRDNTGGITPGLRRRRERNERQKTFMREQQEAAATNGLRSPFASGNKDEFNGLESEIDEKKLLIQLKRDHTVKDLTQKLSSLPTSPQEEKPQNRMGDMTGLISKAKEGLAKSKSKGEISRSPSVDQDIKKSEPKKSENELHWDELVKNISRPLNLCDLDFTDLNSDDEKDVLAPRGLGGGIPPPPPPCGMPPPPGLSGYPPPPKLANLMPPPPTNLVPPPMFNIRSNLNQNIGTMMNGTNGSAGDSNTIKKNKKTVKLFWKEVREDMIPVTIGKTIWDELPQTQVDIQKLEHLFESRAKDLIIKEKQQELNKTKEIIVLDHKRSNAINIAMTKLPPPRAIKAAILKMDATVVTREGIDKLLNMLPTDEERGKIQEAQMSNPELPLGSAEQFLLTLSSISELGARLKLWAFRIDFENSEREIAEPLMDLKQGLELLKHNRTFKCILSTLLSVGIFLNGAPVKGFQIEYLAKVPEVKDTVHKHSLLHHLCHMVMESSPDTTDLYSEIGPITRASKADYTDLAHNLVQLETECKASWDRLKLIAKHDCPSQLKQKLVDFLADCAERIIILQIVHRRVTNRYRKFLLWLGVPQHRIPESRPNEFCRILSEFALEYRTTRERVQQQIEKKANHRERNKTRGKMIIDIPKFRTKEDRADAELKQLLGTPSPTSEQFDNTLTWRRRRAADQIRSPIIMKQNDEQFTDGDDEILESLVKTATKTSGARPTPRERKRTRHADRKSLKRSRTREGFTAERITARTGM